MRRIGTTTDLLLLLAVAIWSLNVTVTRYVLTHGFQPLAYAAVRYAAAAVLAAALVLWLERTLAVHGREAIARVSVAAIFLLLNQLCFVYSLKLAAASTVSLIMGTTPIFAAVLSWTAGLERLDGRFWLAATVSAAGVAMVAAGSGGELSADLGGDLFALGLAGTWAAYSVCLAPLMREYSPYRISGLTLLPMTSILLLVSIGQLGEQDYGRVPTLGWLGLVYAVVGPLLLTNVLWFTALGRVGPARATLFANLQPFVAVLFAVGLLSESLTWLQLAGGAAIAVGIAVSRIRRIGRTDPVPAPAE